MRGLALVSILISPALIAGGCGGGGTSSGAGDAGDASTTGGDAGATQPCTPGDVAQLVAQLQGGDAAAADQAYHGLFCSGVDAIDALLVLGDSTATYNGSAYINPNSSFGPIADLPLALLAIYLVDGIRLGNPAPHFSPILSSTPLVDPDALLAIAVQRYRLWWNANRGKPLADLAASNPLDAGGQSLAISWDELAPSVAEQDNPYHCRKNSLGHQVDNSETPFARIPAILLFLTRKPVPPYGWQYSPDIPGRTPYNCLAWALGKTDQWIEEGRLRFGPKYNVRQILPLYGYLRVSSRFNGKRDRRDLVVAGRRRASTPVW